MAEVIGLLGGAYLEEEKVLKVSERCAKADSSDTGRRP